MITVTAGRPEQRSGFSVETATATGEIALTTDLTELPGGTATGFSADVFTLSTASAVEGQEKTVVMLATGETKVALTGTATGRFVLSDEDDLLVLRFLRAKWRVIQSSATLATAT